MSNVSHARSDLSGHPDASEMRARYDRVMGGRDVALVDAPVLPPVAPLSLSRP
ncbi:hypothetical protein SBADM41S_06671 [Streptomyces badius]